MTAEDDGHVTPPPPEVVTPHRCEITWKESEEFQGKGVLSGPQRRPEPEPDVTFGGGASSSSWRSV